MKINLQKLNLAIPKFKDYLEVRKLNGLTNDNYKIQTENSTVFYKVFNTQFTSGLLNRDYERSISKVLPNFPEVFYMDDEIVIRDFIQNVRPIELKDFRQETIQKLNANLLNIHRLTQNINKDNFLLQFVFQNRYLEGLSKKILVSNLRSDQRTTLLRIVEQIKKLGPCLMKFVNQYGGEIRLCHNDLTLGNILVSEINADLLWLIDFDYTNFNPIHYEFGNLFSEMETEFLDKAPFFRINKETKETREIKLLIAKNYLEQKNKSLENLDIFFESSKKMEPIADLFWIIICAESLEIDTNFDFVTYAEARFDLSMHNLKDSGYLEN